MRLWELASSAYNSISGQSLNFFKETYDINDITGDFKNTVTKTLERIKKTDGFIKTLHHCRKMRYSDGSNEIRQYSILEEFQFANDIMQPFLVAMPEYRKEYNRHRAAGFEESFAVHDKFRGNAFKHTDMNYREITSGLAMGEDEKYVMSWDLDEDSKVTNVDRIDVRICWSRLRELDWEDSDPMSQFGSAVE